MTRYTVDRVEREGEELVVMRDGGTGAEAVVWPGLGNNCIEGRLPMARSLDGCAATGETVEALKGPPSLGELRKHPAFWGIPLLFPFPSRVPRGEYEFEGRRYTMPRDFHGFALDAAWRVVSTEAGDDGARLRSVLTSADHSETLEGYPFPYRMEATYELSGEGLRLDVRVTNVGEGNMPFGYGAHPYFRLPLGEKGSFGECVIRVPAGRKWNAPRVMALGERELVWEELCAVVGSAPDVHDLREPTRLVEKTYNGVYAELELKDGFVECSVTDAANWVEAVMRATPNHEVVVVYTHAGAESVCFEPWTCPPNAFNLASRGVRRNGLVVLGPAEEWEGEMWLSVRRAGGG